jgi:hypothetical protein
MNANMRQLVHNTRHIISIFSIELSGLSLPVEYLNGNPAHIGAILETTPGREL